MLHYLNLVTVMSLKNDVLVLRKNICKCPYAKRIQGNVVMHTSQFSSIRKTLIACKSACSAKTGLELDAQNPCKQTNRIKWNTMPASQAEGSLGFSGQVASSNGLAPSQRNQPCFKIQGRCLLRNAI